MNLTDYDLVLCAVPKEKSGDLREAVATLPVRFTSELKDTVARDKVLHVLGGDMLLRLVKALELKKP